MGLIADTARQWVDIPHEPGERLEFAPLNWSQLEIARQVKTQQVMKQAALFSADTIKGLQGDQAQSGSVDPLDALDKATVLADGLKGWSYELPFTREGYKILDEPTSTFAFREIGRRSLVTIEEQGNGAAPLREPT